MLYNFQRLQPNCSIKLWALTHFDYLHSVHKRRYDAIHQAMRQSGEPWDVCKKSYAVRKVVVSEGWPRPMETLTGAD